jgi:GNAT superfamily N-acetyltransferase
MDATDELTIVRLGPGDAAGGLALSSEAHWNQNEADWTFFLSKAIVYGIRAPDCRLIATAALMPYSASDAWISMVLVTASWRRRGLATRLVDECLNTANRLGVTCWLDATPAGVAVYGPLGFTPTIQLQRLRLDRPAAATTGAPPLPQGRLGDFITCDISAMGFDRRMLLAELAGRPTSRLISNGDALALIRDGRTARHIGPVFADGPAHALKMVRGIAANETNPLLIDAVASQDDFVKGLTDAGWTVERPFQRMRFGRATAQGDEPPFAVTGPEYG